MRPMEASVCAMASRRFALGVPSASVYPPTGSFCPTLTAWKFMPNTAGARASSSPSPAAHLWPSARLPSIQLTTACTFTSS
jgi:hypothetical protein